MRRLAVGDPPLAALTAFPGARGEAQNFGLDRATLQRARENIGAHRGHHDRTSAHGTGIVEQQRHDRVAERHVLLALEGQRIHRIDDDARQPRGIEHAFFDVELPGPVLLRHQQALQLVGEARDHTGHRLELLVEKVAQASKFFGIAEFLRLDLLVELRGVDFVVPVVLMAERLLGTMRLHARLRARGVGQLVGLFGAHLGGVFVAFLALGFLHVGFAGLGFAVRVLFLAVLVLVLRVLAFAGIVRRLIGIEFVAELRDRARSSASAWRKRSGRGSYCRASPDPYRHSPR